MSGITLSSAVRTKPKLPSGNFEPDELCAGTSVDGQEGQFGS